MYRVCFVAAVAVALDLAFNDALIRLAALASAFVALNDDFAANNAALADILAIAFADLVLIVLAERC